jgi:hypothetical protein
MKYSKVRSYLTHFSELFCCCLRPYKTSCEMGFHVLNFCVL